MNGAQNNLVGKAFISSYNSEIFRMIGSSFLLLIILPSLLSFYYDIFIVFELLGGLFFFPILMTALRSYEDRSSFAVPTVELILKKSWKVFIVYNQMSGTFLLTHCYPMQGNCGGTNIQVEGL